MLEAVSAANYDAFSALCSKDNFGCRILSAYDAFSDDPRLTTMLYTKNGKAKAAVSFKGGSAVVCGVYSDEMTECLSFSGFDEIFAPIAYGCMELKNKSTGAVAQLQTAINSAAVYERIDAETLREIYAVISSDLPEMIDQPFGEWYVELSHRLRHRNTRIFAVRENGGIVSAAMTAAESKTSAVIGFVRTLKEYRNKGYASGLCESLGNELLKENKKVYICCEDGMLPFYEKIGYVKTAEWFYGNRG